MDSRPARIRKTVFRIWAAARRRWRWIAGGSAAIPILLAASVFWRADAVRDASARAVQARSGVPFLERMLSLKKEGVHFEVSLRRYKKLRGHLTKGPSQ